MNLSQNELLVKKYIVKILSVITCTAPAKHLIYMLNTLPVYY